MLDSTRQLCKADMLVAQKNLQRNAYWDHPDNLFISMLYDEDVVVRRQAFDILLAKRTLILSTDVRQFDI